MEKQLTSSELTRGKVLARNSAMNFIGQTLPMVAALFSIPLLIHGIGTERFGVLTLVWMVIGYFSLFDFGLGRALTQLVAGKIGNGEHGEIPPLVWTALAMLLGFGCVGGLIVFLASGELVGGALNIPPALHDETLLALHTLAATIPLVLVTAALVGVLSAIQRFDVINAVQVPYGVFNFIGPLLVLPFSKSLFALTALLSCGRLIMTSIYVISTLRIMPSLRRKIVFSGSAANRLLRFGGWMTVTNIISPIMVYLDRFVIGAKLSMVDVAHYTTPYEMVTKLWIVPRAITSVIFPAFATAHGKGTDQNIKLFNRATKYTLIILFPVILAFVGFAYEGLSLWLGREFARSSAMVMQILTMGVFVNSIAMVFFAYIQGIGKPRLTATLHLIELPIYLAFFWYAIGEFGIVGAAIAWSSRTAIDAFALLWFSSKNLKDDGDNIFFRASVVLGSAIALLAVPIFLHELWLRSIYVVGLEMAFLACVYCVVFDASERDAVRSFVTRRVSAVLR